MNAKQILARMLDIVNERKKIETDLKTERTKAVKKKEEAEKKLAELGADAEMKTFKDLRNESRDAQDEIDLLDMKLNATKKTDDKTKKVFRAERDELAKYIAEEDKDTARKIREHALEIVKLFEEFNGRLEEVNSVLRKYGNEIGIPSVELNGIICKGITSKSIILALKNQAGKTAAAISADGKVTGL